MSKLRRGRPNDVVGRIALIGRLKLRDRLIEDGLSVGVEAGEEVEEVHVEAEAHDVSLIVPNRDAEANERRIASTRAMESVKVLSLSHDLSEVELSLLMVITSA